MKFKTKFNSIFFGILLTLSALPNIAAAALINVDITAGVWSVSAVDKSGLTWGGSTLVFETLTNSGDDIPLTGYFDWVGSNGAFGRENFTGTLFSDHTLSLSGFEIVQPAAGIVTAHYFAILSELGTELFNGSWDGSGIPSDDWSATLTLQQVPLPAAIWLLIAGFISLLVIIKKRPIH